MNSLKVKRAVSALLLMGSISVQAALVGHWTFDEGSGTTAGNSASTGSAYNGTVNGSPAWVPGHDGTGYALDINGTTGNYVSLSDVSLLAGVTNEISIAFWAYGNDSQPAENIVFQGGPGRTLQSHLPWPESTVYWDVANAANTRQKFSAAESLWKGNWTFWVMTKNATEGTQKVYANGQLLNTASGLTEAIGTVTGFAMGADVNGSSPYPGIIDDFRIYDHELSEDEIFSISLPSWHVEAEDYDSMNGLRLETTTDTGGGQNIAYIDDGDWAQYTIDVQTPGQHKLEFRVAANTGGDGSINIVSGSDTLGSLYVGDTGGWQTWVTKTAFVDFPTAGTQTLRLNFEVPSGGFNVNWFTYEPFSAEAEVTLTVGTERKQMMRYGLDYERLWFWYGSGLGDVPQWSVNDCNVDFLRTAMNSKYELDEGSYDLSAYTQKIIPMMTAMQEANPNIKWFASPRPLNEAVSSATWQPYPIWVTGASSYTAGDYDFHADKCAEYMIRYLLLMKSYGFKITYMDLTNEWQGNYASSGRFAPDDAVAIKQVFDDYLVNPWPHPALDQGLLLDADDFPLMIGASSWNYSQGSQWISKFTTAARRNAIDIASSHNTDKTGTAQDFADASKTALGDDAEIWETEQHGWKGNSSTSEAMSFSYMIETVRAGFTGLSGWLAIGTTSQGHCYLLNKGSRVVRNVKYYMFQKLSNTSNYGYALDIEQTGDLSSTMALIRDNLLTIWVINTASGSVVTEFDLAGHGWDGSEIKWTRWDEGLSIDGDQTPEGIEGVPYETSVSSFTAVLDGRATYCFEIPLVDNEDNFPFVQAETFTTGSGVSTPGDYVAFASASSEIAFDLDIVKTYPHDVAFSVSSEHADIAFDIYDGDTLIGSVNRMATGGAQAWTTIYKTLHLDGGPMDLRIVANSGGWNLNWIAFDQQFYSPTGGDPASDPFVDSMTIDDNALALSWSGVEGSTYALQRSTNLVDGFSTIESGIPVHGATNINTMATQDDTSFYQIILED